MYVIGIGGFKRSGKDTFAEQLAHAVRQRGLVPVMTAFATAVRHAAAAAYGVDESVFFDAKDTIHPEWGITPRQMMINEGEGMRSIDPDHWIKVWRRRIAVYNRPELVIIVSDVRQLNEAVEIASLGGTLALMQRPDKEWDGTAVEWLAHHFAAPPHGPFSAIVKNDGDVASLRRHADRIVRRVLDKAAKQNSSK